MSIHSEKATLTLNGEPEAGAGPAADPHSARVAGMGGVLRLPARPRRKRARSILFLVLLLVGAAAAVGWWRGGPLWARYGPSWARSWGKDQAKRLATPDTYEVQRGDLAIVISEGGGLEAVRSEIIKSEVEGHATIISLVPEGTLIAEDDVKKGKILVELGSDEIREKLTTQEITHATAKSAFTEAKEGYEIQKSQCESNLTEGELNVKLGRMDLELYVGRDLAGDALEGRVDLLKLAEQLHQKACDQRGTVEADLASTLVEAEKALKEAASEGDEGRGPGDGKSNQPAGDGSVTPGVPRPVSQPPEKEGKAPTKASAEAVVAGAKTNGSTEVTEPKAPERLGGTALQKKRDLESDIGLAHEEFKRGAEKLVWTARLERKGYVSHSELETDRLGFKRSLVTLQQALSARELFLRYQFPKDAEKLLSGFVEAGRELERIKAKSRSTLAQAEAKLKSAQATFKLQDDRLQKLTKQVSACVIRAKQPGLVVYASTGDSWRQMNQPIDVGVSVHERQEILKIPDVSALAAEIRVHESVVSRVKPGLTARVRVDAFPKLLLSGKVSKVGVLANSQNRWLNPDLKQYDTQVVLDQTPSYLKPGMSAKVELLVTTLKSVLLVPVQAVAMREGKTVVYVLGEQGESPREVTVGESNQELVEIRDGIAEGDTILLRAPQVVTVQDEREKREAEKKREEARARQEAERLKEAKEGNGFNGRKPPGPPEIGAASPGGSDAAEDSGSRVKTKPRPAEPADTSIRSPLLRPKGDAKKR